MSLLHDILLFQVRLSIVFAGILRPPVVSRIYPLYHGKSLNFINALAQPH